MMKTNNQSTLAAVAAEIAECWRTLGYEETPVDVREKLVEEIGEFYKAVREGNVADQVMELADVAIMVVRVLVHLGMNPDEVFRVRGEVIRRRHRKAVEIYREHASRLSSTRGGFRSYQAAKALLADDESRFIEQFLKREGEVQ